MSETGRARLALGFTSFKELFINMLGAGVLIYGVTGAAADRALLVVGAGFGLLGIPLAGNIFERKQ